MLGPEDLADLHEIIPGIKPCKLYEQLADSQLGQPVNVGSSEKRPMSLKTQRLLDLVESEIETATFMLWVSTFSRAVVVRANAVIEETSGKQWKVHSAKLEMMETRYRCECVEVFR